MSDDLEEGALLDPIFEEAARLGLTQKGLAEKAGLSAEGLSRLKKRGRAQLGTVERLAGLVGLALAVVPTGTPARRPGRSAPRRVAASFSERHPELVWSNSRAPSEVFIQRALLDPRFGVLLDAATEFGLARVEHEWSALVSAPSGEVRRAAPMTERILRNIRRGYEQATR